MNKASEIRELLGVRSGVPLVREPFWWDGRLPVAANVNAIEGEFRKYRGYLPAGAEFDEAAIMVPTYAHRHQLIANLEGHGWEVFNEAADLVHASPLSTRYTVEYTFLQNPDKPYRLELMLLGMPTEDGGVGFSPLHQALWHPDGITPMWIDHTRFPVPHLSFKPTPEMVEALGNQRAGRRLVDTMRDLHGFILAQACQSTYGEFWYLADPNATRTIYLKPRVNLREEA